VPGETSIVSERCHQECDVNNYHCATNDSVIEEISYLSRRVSYGLSMRSDILPLCDKHYRTMEACVAPYSNDYSLEFFRCTGQFCHRCFSERLGYVTPKRGEPPLVAPDQPRCDYHNRPMFISSLDRQRNIIRYSCPEPNCAETGTESLAPATQPRPL
jgi:hypothetical protein